MYSSYNKCPNIFGGEAGGILPSSMQEIQGAQPTMFGQTREIVNASGQWCHEAQDQKCWGPPEESMSVGIKIVVNHVHLMDGLSS